MCEYDKDFVPEWNYENVCNNVRRYSFESKMNQALQASKKVLLYFLNRDIEYLRTIALPHEIETFVALSIVKGEWKKDVFKEKEFCKCIEGIRNQKHPLLFSNEGDDFGRWYLIVASANQFDFQTSIPYRISRFLEYYTYCDPDIDMNKIFMDKFGVNYLEFVAPILYLFICMADNNSFDERILYELKDKYRKTFEALSITREDYLKEMNLISTVENDYLYCLKPSYVMPFIEFDGILYNPTPHLLIRAVTSSLMYRITERRDDLRATIGKNVYEGYLLKIINECGIFSEAKGEQIYGNDQRTLDVMTTIGDDIICFESKSFSPQINIRIFSEESVENSIKRLSEAVVQVYKHIHDKIEKEYDYLEKKVDENKSNIFGLVVVENNPFIRLEEIYRQAAEELNIYSLIDDYNWLCGHIGIVDIDLLEVQLFRGKDIQQAIRKNLRTGRYSDSWFTQSEIDTSRKPPNFVENNINRVKETMRKGREKM